MSITIYGASHYDRSGKLRWLLEELGARYENGWLDLEKGDLESASYLKVNPLGRIPAAVFGDRPMIESGAIASYLADLHPEKGLAPALGSKERQDYLQWMFFAVSIDSFTSRISIIEDIPAGEVLDKKLGAFIQEVKDHLRHLNHALEGKEFLIGSFSAADVCVGYHLYFASLWPELNDIIESNANVSSYLKRLKARQAAIDAKVFTFEN
jgi:glutathione S-transferase